MNEGILDEILATDKKIRYVGILDSDLEHVISKARSDVRLLLGDSEADESLTMQFSPIIIEALSQFTDNFGKLICSGARFDKVTLMFFKMGDRYVVVNADPSPPYPIMVKLEKKFQT